MFKYTERKTTQDMSLMPQCDRVSTRGTVDVVMMHHRLMLLREDDYVRWFLLTLNENLIVY